MLASRLPSHLLLSVRSFSSCDRREMFSSGEREVGHLANSHAISCSLENSHVVAIHYMYTTCTM